MATEKLDVYYCTNHGTLMVYKNYPSRHKVDEWGVDVLRNATIEVIGSVLYLEGDKISYYHHSKWDDHRLVFKDAKGLNLDIERDGYFQKKYFLCGPNIKYVNYGLHELKKTEKIKIKTSSFILKDYNQQ